MPVFALFLAGCLPSPIEGAWRLVSLDALIPNELAGGPPTVLQDRTFGSVSIGPLERGNLRINYVDSNLVDHDLRLEGPFSDSGMGGYTYEVNGTLEFSTGGQRRNEDNVSGTLECELGPIEGWLRRMSCGDELLLDSAATLEIVMEFES